MDNLEDDLMADFKKGKLGWRPGMGLWMGEVTYQIKHLECEAQLLIGRIKELERAVDKLAKEHEVKKAKIATLEAKIYRPHRKKVPAPEATVAISEASVTICDETS